MSRVCAVVPAAGRGSRLGLECPKILAPIDGERCIWNVVRECIAPLVDQIHVVLAPHMVPEFLRVLAVNDPQVTVSEQTEPLGMGDAIFGAEKFWSGFESILIVWGDQVNLSGNTLRSTIARAHPEQTIVLPLVQLSSPYVQYDIEGGVLEAVRQTREGDTMDKTGLSDVGVFMLSVKELAFCWDRFARQSAPGAQTGELNFLPFLPFLSLQCGWQLRTVDVADPVEARGVNTPEDLQFARDRLSQRSRQ